MELKRIKYKQVNQDEITVNNLESLTIEYDTEYPSPSASPSASVSASPSSSASASPSPSISSSPSAAPLPDYSSIPGADAFIAKAIDTAHLHTPGVGNPDYDYDGAQCFYNLSDISGLDYTGEAEAWATQYVDFWGNNGFNVQGYRNYSLGLYERWLRTGNESHYIDLESFLLSGGYSRPDQNDHLGHYWDGSQFIQTDPDADVYNAQNAACTRENAYALMHWVMREKARTLRGDSPAREEYPDVMNGILYSRLERTVEYAKKHHTEYIADRWSIKPFMIALSSYALIRATEVDNLITEDEAETFIKLLWDDLIPNLMHQHSDGYWTTIYRWIPAGAVDLSPNEVPGQPSNDLNMIVAAPLAWLYKRTGDTQYSDLVDKLIEGSTYKAWWETTYHKQWKQQLMLAKFVLDNRLGI